MSGKVRKESCPSRKIQSEVLSLASRIMHGWERADWSARNRSQGGGGKECSTKKSHGKKKNCHIIQESGGTKRIPGCESWSAERYWKRVRR